MKLLHEFAVGEISSEIFCELSDAIESFLVRRAIVGIEPTGLLVMFRTLFQSIEKNPSRNELLASIRPL